MSSRGPLDTPSGVLAAARAGRRAADLAEVEVLRAAEAWARMHPASGPADAATIVEHGRESMILIAGEGAPLVAEFCVAEFAAVLGLSTGAGRSLLGNAVELRHRLPRLWRRVMAGELPVWRARRIAESTLDLSPEAADFVDRHVAPVAHRTGPAVTDRLVTEAVARFHPDRLPVDEHDCPDRRHVTVETDQVSFDGTVRMFAELDLVDAHDFDAAVTAGAEERGRLGSQESVNARRAAAVGDLARAQLALILHSDADESEGAASDAEASDADATGATAPSDEARDEPTAANPVGDAEPATKGSRTGSVPSGRVSRRLVLYVHLSEAAVCGVGTGRSGGDVARVESGRGHPVTADQVKAWCGRPDLQVVVKPVLDLADGARTDAYEVPDRIAEQARLRDGGCAFPWCGRPARSCDLDHVVPHSRGGPTSAANLANLCRRHHRLKTHAGRDRPDGDDGVDPLAGWSYTVLEPGVYLWSSPHGYRFLVDHRGTRDVTPGVTPPTARAPAPPDG